MFVHLINSVRLVGRSTLFRCDYGYILGDGATVPSTPDLSSPTYLRQFIIGEKICATPYIIDFDLTIDLV